MTRPAATVITVTPVTAENWRDTLELGVHPEQQRFVSAHVPISLVGLAKGYVKALGFEWTAFIFRLADSTPIGFAMIATEPDAACCWIFHFFIDSKFQGKGLGTIAIKELLALIQGLTDCRSVRLTVHPDNQSAQRLYSRAGFVPTGEYAFGEPVLSRTIDP